MGLTLQDRDKTGHTDGCVAMKDGREECGCAYSCVGLASQQSAQYSAVDELRMASTGALFLRARLLVDSSHSSGICPRARIPDRGWVVYVFEITYSIYSKYIKYWRVQFLAKNA